MEWFQDIHNRRVRLSSERLEHMEGDHPEMAGQVGKIKETLLSPDIIVESKTDSEVELFYKLYLSTPVTRKHLCIVVKRLKEDVFIITAYFTDRIKRGSLLWEKK
jgi:hypothetical protein